MKLSLFLANAYNAPWPKSFNPTAFITPEMETIQNSDKFKEMSNEDLTCIAVALISENEDLRPTSFWDVYLRPIEFIINQ